jgi:tetratricopeptide (TPR) repeat protein
MPHTLRASQKTKQSLRRGFLTTSGLREANASGTGTDDIAVLYQQSLEAARAGNAGLALKLVTRACAAEPVPAPFHRQRADMLRRCGKRDEAQRLLRELVERDPEDALSWALLGDLAVERKDLDASRHCYETAIALNPRLLESMHNLGTVLQLLGRADEAEALYRRMIRQAPHRVAAHLNLAIALNTLGRYREALSLVDAVLARSPQIANAHVIASAVEFNLGRTVIALKRIEDAIALCPDRMDFLTRRANILCRLGHNDLALADCDRILTHRPDDPEAWRQKGAVLRALGRAEEALHDLLKAESLSPDPAAVSVDRAWLLAELGRKEQALQLLRETLVARPGLVSALDCISFLAPVKPGDADLAAMEKIVASDDTPIGDRARLSLSVGRSYLDAGDGEKAFHYLNLGNGLKRKTVEYDRAMEERWFADIVALLSPQAMAALADASRQSAKPIFVFGIPRSGTTLVEQILASHPTVHGIGETACLDTLARTSIFSGTPGLTADNLVACGTRYLEMVGAHLPASMRFVDKTNSSFLYAGLIALMFPHARMIHCRRNPLDTGLSCYSLLFAHGNEFCYDFADFGHYYGLYRRLMAHWRKLLPPESLLEIDYELLVDDPETKVREILAFCGLPWDDGCLRFYETKRLVTTSSLGQVRSPIYKARVGRAERFRPWLGPLEQALENEFGRSA